MVKNLTIEAEEKLKDFQDKVKVDDESKLTVNDKCMISIAESMLILAEKIGKKLI